MTIPESARVTIEEGVVVGTTGRRDLKADIYIPPGRPTSAPGVLLVHGGAWREGDRSQLRGYGILLGRLGYVCVACEYRLSGEAQWPAHIHDVKAALRWMRANSARLGVDPARIAVEGNSAGGHLALMVAGTPNLPEFEGEGGNPGVDTSVAACIAFYAPAELVRRNTPIDVERELMGPGASDEAYRAASPLTYARADFPPTLLMHGGNDELVSERESVKMYEALRKAGAPVELHIYAGQPHAFDSAPLFGRQGAAIMDLFLRRYVVECAPEPVAAT